MVTRLVISRRINILLKQEVFVLFVLIHTLLYFPQGTILGAFYYGYTAMQIPGGWLGQRFGGTRVFGICLGIASILTMLTPLAARTSVAALITLRVIEGLALVSKQILECLLNKLPCQTISKVQNVIVKDSVHGPQFLIFKIN